jgi:hypothetical protein
MALYALLKCEVPATDPAIVKGLAWLKKAGLNKDNSSSYEIAASLLAVTATADPFKKTKDAAAAGAKVRLAPEHKPFAATLQKALLDRRHPRGWRYSKAGVNPGGTEDVSATMFAMLALTAADRCGLPLDPNIVVGVASYVMTLQEKDGPEVPRAVRARRPAAAKPDKDKGRYAGPGSPEEPKTTPAASTTRGPLDEGRRQGRHRRAHVGTALTLARYFLSTAARPRETDHPAEDARPLHLRRPAWLAQN